MKPIHVLLPVFFLLLCSPGVSSACVWTYGTGLDGGEVAIDAAQSLEDAISSYLNRLREYPERLDNLRKDSIWRAGMLLDSNDYTLRNDYAVNILRLGHFAEALAMFLAIEREHPGQYETASNIGTVYELLGRNDSALHWIREGLRRNPDSHYRTEWLHVRILEAKTAMAADPGWIRRNTVLGLDFGTGTIPADPKIPAGYPQPDLYFIAQSLFYQLGERLHFTPAPDPLAADLLIDLGNSLVRANEPLQIAVEVYKLALAYGPEHSPLLEPRIAALNRIIEEHPPSHNNYERFWRDHRITITAIAGGWVLLFGGIIALVVWYDLRTRNKRRGIV